MRRGRRPRTTTWSRREAVMKARQAEVIPKLGRLMITRNETPITILLVDDDADCRMLIRDAIAECKVSNDVHEVADGLEAMAFLERSGRYAKAPRPGLIFMD